MRRLVAVVMSGALVSACQTLQPPPAPIPQGQSSQWAQRQQDLAAIQHFGLHGRIASNTLGAGSGDIAWDQSDDHFTVQLSGTFGIGAVRIEGTPERMTIITRDGHYQADEAEETLRERLGAPLPVADLRYWILGLPRPNSTADIQLDSEGRLSQLVQDGWTLDYVDYRQGDDSRYSLPHKLWLSSGTSRWKLVIDHWEPIS